MARILLSPIDELRKTDITEHALNSLAESKLKELYFVGRRGPLQVAFTIKELREQLKLKTCTTVWRQEDFVGVQDVVGNLARPRKRLTELMLKSLNEMTKSDTKDKIFKPLFYRSPNKFIIDENKDLTGIELICNKLEGDKIEEQRCVPTDLKEIINCSLAFRSIGYKSIKVDRDLVFNKNGVLINDRGRVNQMDSKGLAKMYVAGWLGTGPVGVILHTMGNAFQVAKTICEDLQSTDTNNLKGGFAEIKKIILENNNNIVDWRGWENIDKYETEQGKKVGKPREKICDIEKMLEVART